MMEGGLDPMTSNGGFKAADSVSKMLSEEGENSLKANSISIQKAPNSV
jgi:hypothetical protein